MELLEDAEPTRLNRTLYTQPALVAVEYALLQLWQSWGVVPDVVLGHSLGEYAAAAAAGMLSWPAALKLVARRARLMQALPPGAMAAVLASAETLGPHLERAADQNQDQDQNISIAAFNSPTNTVLSGPAAQLEPLLAQLEAAGMGVVRLAVSHAFHSAAIEPLRPSLARELAAIDWQPARVPLVKNLDGALLPAGQTLGPDYWLAQARQGVQFQAGVETLLAQDCGLLLEIGPAATLIQLARQTAESRQNAPSPGSPSAAVSTSPKYVASLARGGPWRQLASAVGQLYVAGYPIDWEAFDRDYTRRHVPLPTYPFQRKRYWLTDLPQQPASQQPISQQPVSQEPAAAEPGSAPNPASWLYELQWRPQPLASRGPASPAAWLVLDEGHPQGAELVRQLQSGGAAGRLGPGRHELPAARCRSLDLRSAPGRPITRRLLAQFDPRTSTPGRLLQLLPAGGPPQTTLAELALGGPAGHEPLLALCEALAERLAGAGRAGSSYC